LSSPRVRPHRALLALLLPALAAVAGGADPNPDGAGTDPRQTYREGESPAWLRAVGRLEVPGIRYEDGRRRHHTERCSATLVGTGADRPADTIVTAWHCLEYYEDLSQRIEFTLATAGGELLTIEATRLEDGGGMGGDWAILRLRRAVAPREAPALSTRSAGIGADAPVLGAPLLMAGFSRDEGLGQGGTLLSYDAACRITGRGDDYADSDCRAHKGASGGAVIELDEGGEPRFSGVISQGDGAGLSRFVPVAVFRGALAAQLRR
jgi:Trypsin-like peptidase domain